jgi:endonuclease/exonuclease/phosphatase family metal-dependent hydrolase
VRIRAATFNVRSFRSGVDRVAGVFDHPLDILLVQECGPRRLTAAFGDVLGMRFVSSHRAFKRVRNAVLFGSSWKLEHEEVHDLTPRGNTLPRGFVAARLRAGAVRLTAVSVHLGLSPGERRHHVVELADALIAAGGNLLVGADLNEGPSEPAARWLAGRLFDAFAGMGDDEGATFPAPAPSARIDYLFAGGGLRVVDCRVLEGPGVGAVSDHVPVIGEFDVSETP